MKPIDLVLVEDNSEIRETLILALGEDQRFELLAAYANAEACIREIQIHTPEVVIMDISLPGLDGVEAVARVKSLLPQVQVLMFTVFDEEDILFQALKNGATGYLLKESGIEELKNGIIQIQSGGSPMSASIARRVVSSFNALNRVGLQNAAHNLSVRERQILTQLADGARYKDIAAQLSISIDTVRTHIRHIYEKLQVNSRTEAINKIMRP
ncbi:MAG: response regulator transcription factor [Flavobacteriales bacterium]|nr:response regulator transcription factor [Flavobacteriales bacterium]